MLSGPRDYVNVSSMEQTFFVEAMVRGYHVYQAIWEAALLEELPCQREVGNRHDRCCGQSKYYSRSCA